MKEGSTPLYATPKLAESVSQYSQQHSTALPKHLTDYHAAFINRPDANMLSSNFQSQLHLLLAHSIGAKRGMYCRHVTTVQEPETDLS